MRAASRNALDVEVSDPADFVPHDARAARALDQAASEELGVPAIVLMENAARGAAACLIAEFGREARVLVLAGKGNNGGDGMALARWLAPRAHVVLLDEPDAAKSPDAALQLEILRQGGVPVEVAPASSRLDALLTGADVTVDALLGTGLSSAPRGRVASWIEWINATTSPVLAIDLPSGLGSDDGQAFDPCVSAEVTVSFARPKHGLLIGDGPEHSGRVHVVSLGLPEPWVEAREKSGR